ncbi:hypothetical protein BPC006_II2569 [Burkholderia pseudomallei BPC006]|nr:hypothetical protein BURPS668_A2750 [Burkholderia pseudomallei 668]AFR20494.1 hypothetical protein BPC006_II2569 [Burkholderia pseudomallei BPC006]
MIRAARCSGAAPARCARDAHRRGRDPMALDASQAAPAPRGFNR